MKYFNTLTILFTLRTTSLDAFNLSKFRSSFFRKTDLRKSFSRIKTSIRFAPNVNLIEKNVEEDMFDEMLQENKLGKATKLLKSKPSLIRVNNLRLLNIFRAIEKRTKEAEENNINTRMAEYDNVSRGGMEYPPISPARMEMTEMYQLLRQYGHLKVFGAASKDQYLASGSKNITPLLLERITKLSMTSLTPKPTNTLLYAGAVLAILEGILSLVSGIKLNFLIFFTLLIGFLDKLLVNGALFETTTRILFPEYGKKILRHEAGHFLVAYLIGCPVEGCVLSSWGALQDARFGGKRTTVSAGTSFFDPELSDEINGRKPLTRSSIDRYSVIVMGGIAAEAISFGGADGGYGDELALMKFLTNLNPRAGGAQSWNISSIKNQARWGALQAILLLKEYKPCYESLVDALERGGDLGDCILAIETAAKENGLGSIQKPLGYLSDGDWVIMDQISSTKTVGVATKRDEISKDELMSLAELKAQMERKLRDIDTQLDRLQ